MARKEIAKIIKVNLKGGAASPAPPLGPALSAAGVQVMEFVRTFNDQTRPRADELLPTEIFIYKDKSWEYKIKTPITSILVKKELGLEKGSAEPNRQRVGELSREQLERIAKIKLPDLNTNDLEMATRIVAGTCRQMGVNVEGYYWEVAKARRIIVEPEADKAEGEEEEEAEGGEE
jgi:large subunit ribosomal protein L11